MRKIIAVVILCLFVTGSAKADPFSSLWHWAGHHKRFLLMEGAAVGAASVHAYGLHHCRRLNGVEPCDAHYGEAWMSFAFATGLTTVVMPALAEGCWHANDDSKACYPLAYGGSAVQLGWGVHEARISEHAEMLKKHCFVNCRKDDKD